MISYDLQSSEFQSVICEIFQCIRTIPTSAGSFSTEYIVYSETPAAYSPFHEPTSNAFLNFFAVHLIFRIESDGQP